MRSCSTVRSQFSEYLDGQMTGTAMQKVAGHMRQCSECRAEFDGWKKTQAALADLGSLKAPSDLALRLRVAISQERTHTPRREMGRWKVYWQNTIAPLALQASAGFASAVLLIGTVTLMVGMFAKPEPLAAQDEPIGNASTPRFLYSAAQVVEEDRRREIVGEEDVGLAVAVVVGPRRLVRVPVDRERGILQALRPGLVRGVGQHDADIFPVEPVPQGRLDADVGGDPGA